MAVATDTQIKSMFERNAEGFALLSKTRQELAGMIPQSAGAQDVANDPSVVGIQEQLLLHNLQEQLVFLSTSPSSTPAGISSVKK